MENLVGGDAEISTKTDNKDILVNINGAGTMAFFGKDKLAFLYNQHSSRIWFNERSKEGVEKIGTKTWGKWGYTYMEREAAQICLLHNFYLPSCLFTYVSDIDEHAEWRGHLSIKISSFSRPLQNRLPPLPLSRGLYQIPPSWWLAPGKAASLTIIKRGLTPHHESASIGHFHTDVAILGNNSFTGSLRLGERSKSNMAESKDKTDQRNYCGCFSKPI